MKAFIEQIEIGRQEYKIPFTNIRLKKTPDYLDISNGKWLLSIFSGYRQLGRFPIGRPHDFKEREWVDIEIADGKIVKVTKIKEE